jgi:hypothetical protein
MVFNAIEKTKDWAICGIGFYVRDLRDIEKWINIDVIYMDNKRYIMGFHYEKKV